MLYFFGKNLPTPIYPGTVPIAQMGPSDLWASYIRPMGAGPWPQPGSSALQDAADDHRGAAFRVQEHARTGSAESVAPLRTEHDLSMGFAVVGSIAFIVICFCSSPSSPFPARRWACLPTSVLHCWW